MYRLNGNAILTWALKRSAVMISPTASANRSVTGDPSPTIWALKLSAARTLSANYRVAGRAAGPHRSMFTAGELSVAHSGSCLDARWVLAGEKGMMVWWSVKTGMHAAAHSHPHEQIMWILKGKLEFRMGNESRVLNPGDVVVIPGGVDHEGWCREDAEVVDFFAPRREDFLGAEAPAYMREK